MSGKTWPPMNFNFQLSHQVLYQWESNTCPPDQEIILKIKETVSVFRLVQHGIFSICTALANHPKENGTWSEPKTYIKRTQIFCTYWLCTHFSIIQGNFWTFLCTLFKTASCATPRNPLRQRMLGLNPELLRTCYFGVGSQTLKLLYILGKNSSTTRLDLIHTRLDLIYLG